MNYYQIIMLNKPNSVFTKHKYTNESNTRPKIPKKLMFIKNDLDMVLLGIY